MNYISDALERHKLEGTFRSLQSSDGLKDFSSNDYLGLSQSPMVRAKLIREIENGCPLGATGSRLLSGHTEIHSQVEQFLIQTYGAPSALLFSSGYMANVGVLSTFASIGAHFFSDEQNHASIIDGMKEQKSSKTIFRHNDLTHLKSCLSTANSVTKVVVTESVFSMSGDIAPLAELHALAKQFDAWLVVDEAHATGVFGKNGRGLLSEFGSQDEKVVSVHTGGKALGGQGAFVLSGSEFHKLLVNRARTFIFSTGLSPLTALQMQFAIEEALLMSLERDALWDSVFHMRQRLSDLGFKTEGASQIVPIILGSNESALKLSRHMQGLGFDVRAIRSPTVPPGSERLRITLKSFHNREAVDDFVEAIGCAPV